MEKHYTFLSFEEEGKERKARSGEVRVGRLGRDSGSEVDGWMDGRFYLVI